MFVCEKGSDKRKAEMGKKIRDGILPMRPPLCCPVNAAKSG